MNLPKVRIDLVSDVVCPWCIIGYKRLEKALEIIADKVTAEIHWHPFELNPNMPDGGQNVTEHVMEKYGITAEASKKNRAEMSQVAADLGFTFNLSDDSRMYNTFQAHQLLHHAETLGKETDLKLRLFSAFFSEGKAVDHVEVLVSEAVTVGLDEAESRAVLTDHRYAQIVKQHEQEWLKLGVNSVPTFVFDKKYAVVGAQEPVALAEQILRSIS